MRTLRGGERQPRRHRLLAGGVEQSLGFLADPERTGAHRRVRPRLHDGARRHLRASPGHLVAVVQEVEPTHPAGTRTKPSISRRAVRYTVTVSAFGPPPPVATLGAVVKKSDPPHRAGPRTKPSISRRAVRYTVTVSAFGPPPPVATRAAIGRMAVGCSRRAAAAGRGGAPFAPDS